LNEFASFQRRVKEVPPEAADGFLVEGSVDEVLGDGVTGVLDAVFGQGAGEGTSDLFASRNLDGIHAVAEVSTMLGRISLVVGIWSLREIVRVASVLDAFGFEFLDDLCGAVFADEIGVEGESIDDGHEI
jgi:hypothetical protein